METEVIEPETALSLIPHDAQITRAPREVLDGAIEAARALKEVISQKKRPVVFRGEQYLQYEDWQTIGGFFGSSVATGDAELIDIDGVRGFRAKARVIDSNGVEVSAAEAYCMKDEDNWKGKPLFQLASMAQTRAGAKALRNKFAWVAVLAGYSPTPAEEVVASEGGEEVAQDVPRCEKCDSQVWDNRKTKKGNQPDFKCRNRSCGHAVWLNKEPITEGYGTDAALRDDLFKQAEKLLAKLPEEKRKDALGRLVALSTDEMSKKVNELAENARKKSNGVNPAPEEERQAKIMSICENVPNSLIEAYLKERYEGKTLNELSLDALISIYDELYEDIPF